MKPAQRVELGATMVATDDGSLEVVIVERRQMPLGDGGEPLPLLRVYAHALPTRCEAPLADIVAEVVRSHMAALLAVRP